jgi:glyceraldehyde 3-phosphate dehydrogenase
VTIKIGINGFGRIGKIVFRQLFERFSHKNVRFFINDLASPDQIRYALQYDSNYGIFSHPVTVEGQAIRVKDHLIPIYKETSPEKIQWDVDYVIEATGRFTALDKASLHNAHKKVLITGPSKDVPMVVLGVNDHILDEGHRHLSIASCTTNCLAPLIKVVDEHFGVVEGLMTTVHACTQSQLLVDGYREDLRDGRSAFQNIVPSSTGAAKAVGLVYPKLKGKVTGLAFRVPIATVSVVDLTVRLEKKTNLEQIIEVYKEVSQGSMRGILGVTTEEAVSSDFIGDTRSSILDAGSCVQLNEHFFKLISWYDNEWGYSARVCDVLDRIINTMD